MAKSDAAMGAINAKGEGGLMGFLKDVGIVVGTGAVGTVALAGTAALMAKTPVGGWLGNAQAPGLLAAGAVLGPVAGMVHPMLGLGVGVPLVALAGYTFLAGPLGLPRMAAPETTPAVTAGWGAAFGEFGVVDPSLQGNRAISASESDALFGGARAAAGMGVVDPSLQGLGVVDPTLSAFGALGPGPMAISAILS